jgi:hypothetical protein
MAAITPKVSIMTIYTIDNAVTTTLLEALQQQVLTGLSLENGCYPTSKLMTYRVQALLHKLAPETVTLLANVARQQPALRNVALLLARELVRFTQGTEHSKLIAPLLVQIIQQPDDLIDFTAIYWQAGKQPLTKQIKKGMALALHKFDATALAQCSDKQKLKLWDIVCLVHPHTKNPEQAAAWQHLAINKRRSRCHT